MYVGRIISIKLILLFAWQSLLVFTLYSIAIVCLRQFGGFTQLGIPFLPIGLIGTAVAFYVGFKNNSSYERLWEARRIWGAITNASRTFAVMLNTFINKEAAPSVKLTLVKNHLAYINALRTQLRGRKVWEKEHKVARDIVTKYTHIHDDNLIDELNNYLPADEVEKIKGMANPATHLLNMQGILIADLENKGYITELEKIEFNRIITELYTQQGGCERIKTFPFPRQYAFFSRVFVWIFIMLLPWGLIQELGKTDCGIFIWLTVPLYIVIAWIFYTMEVVGDTSENPFENAINDVPMTAICRNIEIDMLQLIGEDKIPERILPEADILM
jgi:ion channel-forming bestrophin family protein